ncbi:hypothetical protein E4U60_004902 [Claviceps pazoutovae]|uniref:Retrotransposon gag domain-containing protein n=1 Tax=Claviceps pazoutovae TaxID=1649127 RepID=A0A9P7M883_9HYPO|nr:hypothetical protein E4U60_004902 [Claviceps pazoutovae]
METLLNLRQGKNESLQSFIETWRKAVAAYPEPLEEKLRTVWFMQCLNGVMKANVFAQESPSSFNHLMEMAKKAELAVDAGKDDQKIESIGTDRDSKTKKKRRPRCSAPDCRTCHSKLHITTLHHDISK